MLPIRWRARAGGPDPRAPSSEPGLGLPLGVVKMVRRPVIRNERSRDEELELTGDYNEQCDEAVYNFIVNALGPTTPFSCTCC